MKKNRNIIGKTYFFTLVLMIFLMSCKHNEIDKPVTVLQGRVMLIHSNTPVPNALVLFLTYNNDSWATTYTEVGRDTTDADGYYTIPKSSGARLVRAYGPAAIYATPSMDNYIDWQPSEFLDLYLIPPAWLKVRAIDVEPLNPEVLYVHADTLAGSSGEVNISNGFRIWKTEGNIEQELYYYLYYENLEFDWFTKALLPPVPFDTTEVIIEY
jgi:hypothetical protein